MNKKKVFHWTPRILGLLYIAFISMFALDVFGEGYGFPEILVALLMHLLPTFALIILLIMAWKRPKIGGILYLILGIAFTVFFDTYKTAAGFAIISLPLFLVGGLFYLQSRLRR